MSLIRDYDGVLPIDQPVDWAGYGLPLKTTFLATLSGSLKFSLTNSALLDHICLPDPRRCILSAAILDTHAKRRKISILAFH